MIELAMRPFEYMLIDLALGTALALFTIRTVRRFGPARERRFYAVALGVAAFLYVVFALRGEGVRWVGIELAGLLGFGLVAWLGASRGALWLAGGWLAHTAWDVLLHATGTTPFVPPFYPMLCLAYDVVVAAYLVTRRRAWPPRRTSPAPVAEEPRDGPEAPPEAPPVEEAARDAEA